MDIADVCETDKNYVAEDDPRKFVSSKTKRGPLKPNWWKVGVVFSASASHISHVDFRFFYALDTHDFSGLHRNHRAFCRIIFEPVFRVCSKCDWKQCMVFTRVEMVEFLKGASLSSNCT